MSGIRVSAQGPTGQPAPGSPALGAALVPIPARLGQGYQSWGAVNGSPGTTRIPAPAPVPGIDSRGVAQAIEGVGAGGMSQPSEDTPYWTPGIYYQPKLASRFHGAIDSDNQLPLPAENPLKRGRMMVAMPAPVQLRQQQIAWPITTPSYSPRY